MQDILKLFLLYYILFITNLYADSIKDVAQKAHLANINTLLIFTSQEGLNSGLYHFTNVGVDMEVYSLPFSYQLNSNKSSYNYFIVGNVGYSRVFISKDVEIPPNSHLNYHNHIRTYTGGLGGGIRYKVTKELHLSVGVELIYSLSGASVSKPDDDIGDAIEDFFNKQYNDNISYKLFTLAEYRPKLTNFKPYATISYKLYETKSSFSFDELTTFSTESSVTRLTFGAQTYELLRYHKNYLTLEGYINANYLSGIVKKTVKFSSYTSVGAVAYWYTPDTLSWLERFFLEVSTTKADGLDGYNIGVGFSVDF